MFASFLLKICGKQREFFHQSWPNCLDFLELGAHLNRIRYSWKLLQRRLTRNIFHGRLSRRVWPAEKAGLQHLKGEIDVILWWIVFPIMSVIISVLLFIILGTTGTHRKDPFKARIMLIPLLYGFTLSLATVFVVYKGDKRFDLLGQISVGDTVSVSLGSSAAFFIITLVIFMHAAKRCVESLEKREAEMAKNLEDYLEKYKRTKSVTDALRKIGVNLGIDENLKKTSFVCMTMWISSTSRRKVCSHGFRFSALPLMYSHMAPMMSPTPCCYQIFGKHTSKVMINSLVWDARKVYPTVVGVRDPVERLAELEIIGHNNSMLEWFSRDVLRNPNGAKCTLKIHWKSLYTG